MRTFFILSALTYSLLTLLSNAAEPVRLYELNLIRNGDFEKSSSDGEPYCWEKRIKEISEVKLSLSQTEGVGASQALKIESLRSEDRPWFSWVQPISISSASAKYKVECDLRTDNVDKSVAVLLAYTDSSGISIKKQVASLQGTRGWKRYNATVIIPPNAKYGNLMFTMHGKGTAWLDNIEVKRLIEPCLDRQESNSTIILKPSGKMVIDGDASDWAAIERKRIAEAYTVSNAEAAFITASESKGAQDLSFDFALSYDKWFIYLLVEVNDNTRVSKKAWKQADSIQFAFDTKYSRSEEKIGPGEGFLGLKVNQDGTEFIIEKITPGIWLDVKDAGIGFKNTDAGYTVELALPRNKLGLREMSHSQRIGFNIVVNDSDGGPRKWAQWCGGLSHDRNPALYGTLVASTTNAPLVTLECTSTCPLQLNASIYSGKATATEDMIDLYLSSGDLTFHESQKVQIQQGVNKIPFVFESGSIRPGDCKASVEYAGGKSSINFNIRPVKEWLEEIHERLSRINEKTEKLQKLIKKSISAGIDIAYIDAASAVAEIFTRFIEADSFRDGMLETALREARQTEQVLDNAIGEAEKSLADPAKHPAVPVPDVMKAVLKNGSWYVDDYPVLMIGLNQMDKEQIDILRRLGGNFMVTGGGNAAWYFKDGENPSTDKISSIKEDVELAASKGMPVDILFSHAMPGWAIEQHPEIVDTFGHFMDYDISHPLATNLTARMMMVVAEALSKYPHVLSYDLWNEAGYNRASPLALNLFRQDMKNKYADIKSLNETWNTRFTSFNDVYIFFEPDKHPAAYIDWCRWNNNRLNSFARTMSNAVKSRDRDALTHIKVGNEKVLEGSINKAGKVSTRTNHDAAQDRWELARILDFHGCDTRPVMQSIDGQYSFAWQYPAMCYDLQRSMFPGKPVFDSEWHGVQTVFWTGPDQPPEFINAALWHSYLHGMDMNILWWWSRSGLQPKSQWFEGSLLTMPLVLNSFARNSIQVQRFTPQIMAFQDTRPRIRLLYSESSAITDIKHLDALRECYRNISWLGSPVGFVTEEMLLDGFSDFDLLIIPAARHAKDGIIEQVNALSQKGLKVVFTGKECLKLTSLGRERKTVEETDKGIEVLASIPDCTELQNIVDSAGIKRVLRCIGPDGKSSNPVEFRAIETDKNLLAYIIGTNKKNIDTTLELNGTPVPSVNILTGDEIPASFTVKPFDVYLLKVSKPFH